MASLRFGSFKPTSAPSRLWGDRVETDETAGSLLHDGCLVRRQFSEDAGSHSQISPQQRHLDEGPGGAGCGQKAPRLLSPELSSASSGEEAGGRSGAQSRYASREMVSGIVDGALGPNTNGQESRAGVSSPGLEQEARASSPCSSPCARPRMVAQQTGESAAWAAADFPVGTPTPGFCPATVGTETGGHNPTVITMEDVILYGGIPDPTSGERRFSHCIQGQPDNDDMQLGRAMRAAKLRDIEATTGCLQSNVLDPYVVVTQPCGLQRSYGYWVQPVGDGRMGYLQPIWMAC